ncbi:tRNA (adenosine(37)-N6)-threonylcarbamoyltransferase complex ATPase subunit type 1 TsaE [Candidatus Wolfebacteria bacterium CG03_land_8_20_14_0_80_40_12]|uniref:tRNA threonylcarbamoyladenosine biosynthesis protein TsaE n=1 Tax=Candidatus Wolfebacteria bacterium CG03_land_8_20_14_0_80_40_12 TaxID=1975069 RepID=A0A2M7B6F1_9BACT|nr:MAG: tRNA (adenosine(37)-N6)-threonylcarbamoyltransferase complex ATPase subunit type 1 TsaE [Candidatus Wolfebacteria bacterium CG03_land_8_20_14_0_80_40_12]
MNKAKHFIFQTHSVSQTQKLAKFLSRKIPKKNLLKGALIFGLEGELGSGKTSFVRGFLRALGIRGKITSPTFVIIKNYGRIYHIDCYRTEKIKELLDLGLKEILANHQNIVLIEWPEKIKKILPKNSIWIKFEHSGKINERIIKFTKH